MFSGRLAAVRPVSVRPLCHLFRVTSHLCIVYTQWIDFNETWHKYSLYEWALLERFWGSEVKGQGHSEDSALVRLRDTHQRTAVRTNVWMWRRHSFRRCGVQADLFVLCNKFKLLTFTGSADTKYMMGNNGYAIGARNFKFRTHIDHQGHYKNRSNAVGKGSRDLLLKFWYPLHIAIWKYDNRSCDEIVLIIR